MGDGPRVLRLRWILTVGYVLVGIGIVLLLMTSQRLLVILGVVSLVFGSLAVVSSIVAGAIRRELRRQASTVTGTVARRMIDLLPPAQVADLLLERVYGPGEANREVATSLLGGEGVAVDGSDLTISDYTEIDYELSRVDDHHYRLVNETRYEFRHRVPTARFVIFATSDPVLRDSIISGCRLPLFELWFVQDDQQAFEESVEDMRAAVLLGMQYTDDVDDDHVIVPRRPERHLREVKLQDWGRYLSFFRSDQGAEPATDRRQYMNRLRIFEVELTVLAEPGTQIKEVRRLTVRSTSLQPFDSRFCYWQPPYPCFVERMHFDVSSLQLDGEPDLLFRLKPFSFRSKVGPLRWSTPDDVKELPMRSWLLPGHGVALMWRPHE